MKAGLERNVYRYRFVIGVLLSASLPVLLSHTTATASLSESELAARLRRDPLAVVRDPQGRPRWVFSVPLAEAPVVFLPVSRERPLPDSYRPLDLVWSMGRPVRDLILGDLRAMIAAAVADDVEMTVVSGYRSPEEQLEALESSAWRLRARTQEAIDFEEAKSRASRFVAPPGHSQHQLGTAVDLSTWELNYVIRPRFAETMAGKWVSRRAWEFGFVLPYTALGEARTGYAYEPWHLRWVGRPLAAAMQADQYLDHPYLVADDYLRAVEEILRWEGVR